ncbi:hypothetical protein GCM10009718_10990 [Isoptericola halotolerans]
MVRDAVAAAGRPVTALNGGPRGGALLLDLLLEPDSFDPPQPLRAGLDRGQVSVRQNRANVRQRDGVLVRDSLAGEAQRQIEADASWPDTWPD